MKKNIAKPIAWSVVGVGILSLIVGTSVDWSHTPLIFASGSSSVQPLIQELSKNFTTADVIANVGGSGMGISEIAHGLKDMGMASKMPSPERIGVSEPVTKRFDDALKDETIEPDQVNHSLYTTTTDDQRQYYLNPNQEFSNWWGGQAKNSQTKTITIAWDAIAIVYSRQGLPDNVHLNLNHNNIADLFAAFSGYQQFNLLDLINKGNNNTQLKGNISLKPYVRAGGANASGTADAFYHDSHLSPDMSGWTDDQKQAYNNTIKKSLGEGSYGAYVQTTNESNSQAWNTLLGGEANQRAGKIIYLSSGFVSQNLNEILNQGFDVAWYNGHDIIQNRNQAPYLDAAQIAKDYQWYRPFNVMINIPNDGLPKPYLIDFINYLLRESQDGKNTTNQPLIENDPTADGINMFEQQGYAPLSRDQILSMTRNRDVDIWDINANESEKIKQDRLNKFIQAFYISDFNLLAKMDTQRFTSRIQNGVLYGANPTPPDQDQLTTGNK